MSRKFYLYQRQGIFYAQVLNPLTGQYLTGKSTGKRDRDEAAYTAMEWIKNGIPKARTGWTRKPINTFHSDKMLQSISDSNLDEVEIGLLLDLLKMKGYITPGKNLDKEKAKPLIFIAFLKNFGIMINLNILKSSTKRAKVSAVEDVKMLSLV